MKIKIKDYPAFLIPYVLFVLGAGWALLSVDKANLHLWLNSYHSPFLNEFFKYYTEVGASIPYVLVFFLLFNKYRTAIFVLAAVSVTALIVQIIKHALNFPRPLKFFEQNFPDVQLPLVPGVRVFTNHSFPSGHSAAAFALFFSFALLTKNRYLQFLCFVGALLVGYSRIYLSQHFLSDVFAGSLVAVVVTLLIKMYMDTFNWKWADGSLRDVLFPKKHI